MWELEALTTTTIGGVAGAGVTPVTILGIATVGIPFGGFTQIADRTTTTDMTVTMGTMGMTGIVAIPGRSGKMVAAILRVRAVPPLHEPVEMRVAERLLL